MATYNYDRDSSGDGWSVTYKIPWPTTSDQRADDIDYYTTISNYSDQPTHASWYQQTWWKAANGHNPQLWAKFFHNETGEDLVMNNMAFVTCPCNSANQSYRASGGILEYTTGLGVDFRARYYVLGNDGVSWSDTYSLPDWTSITNSSGKQVGNIAYPAGSIGRTSTTTNPFFSGCRSGGSNANKNNYALYVVSEKYLPLTAELTFEDPIVVPADGYLFLIVDITDWHGGNASHQTIVMLGDDGYFTPGLDVDDKAYIWRRTDMEDGTRQWQKTRCAFMWSGTEWIKMDEKNSEQISEIENRNK